LKNILTFFFKKFLKLVESLELWAMFCGMFLKNTFRIFIWSIFGHLWSYLVVHLVHIWSILFIWCIIGNIYLMHCLIHIIPIKSILPNKPNIFYIPMHQWYYIPIAPMILLPNAPNILYQCTNDSVPMILYPLYIIPMMYTLIILYQWHYTNNI